jgi:hypothetical protein
MSDYTWDLVGKLQDPEFKRLYDCQDTSILVLSCDAYEDIWMPFFTLKDRYWKSCIYPTYIATETKDCPYAKALKHNYPLNQWTRRIRESLAEIETRYVIMMDCDMFIRAEVNRRRISDCIDEMRDGHFLL